MSTKNTIFKLILIFIQVLITVKFLLNYYKKTCTYPTILGLLYKTFIHRQFIACEVIKLD